MYISTYQDPTTVGLILGDCCVSRVQIFCYKVRNYVQILSFRQDMQTFSIRVGKESNDQQLQEILPPLSPTVISVNIFSE